MVDNYGWEDVVLMNCRCCSQTSSCIRQSYRRKVLMRNQYKPQLGAARSYAASPSNLISKVHFSPTGSALTGLNCIGSMRQVPYTSELFGPSSSLPPLA